MALVTAGRRGTLYRLLTVVSLLAILITYALTLLSYSQIMGFDDYFGQMTLDPYAFPLFSAITVLSVALIYSAKRGSNVVFLVVPLAAFVLARFYLPWFTFPQYSSTFYDAPAFLGRTEYVVYTGHTTPIYPLDEIVRQEPGFEWASAMLIDIVSGVPTSPSSFILSFLVKYYNVMEALIYTPIVLYVFRSLGLSVQKSFLGLIIFLGFEFSPNLHFVDQTYSVPLYWLLLLLVYMSVKEGGTRHSLPIAVLSAGIILSQLGVAFFAFFGLLALTIYYLRRHKASLYYTALFGVGWIGYLNYLASVYGGYVVLGYDTVTFYSSPSNAVNVVSQDLYRPLPLWAEIVFYEAVYMAIITLTPVLILFLASRSNRDYRALALLVLITSLVVGPVSVKLGGAGYITRIPQHLMPFLAIAFTEVASSTRFRHILAAAVLALVLVGSLYYYEGRNFEATLNNNYFQFLYAYSTSKPPSFLLTYYYPPTVNATLSGYSVTGLIQSYYYEYGDLSVIRQIIFNTSLKYGIIYMAPGTVIGIA